MILALVAVGALHSGAQSITQAFNEPVTGDVDRNYRLDTSAYTSGLPIQVTGTNVTWDFTKLLGIFPMVIDSFITPSAASGHTGYPAATFAQHRDVVFSFFKSTPGQLELLGAWSSSLAITFTNPAIVATYPVTYGYQMIDPVSGTFTYNTTKGACNGSITVTANALGTMNFPTTSFQNVLCLRSVEQLTMSVGILPVGNIDQYIYSYYVPGKKYPLLTVQYQRYSLLAGTPTITAQAYGNFSYFAVAGLNEQLNEATDVFPNPFSDQLFVDGNFNDYSLTDTHGREIMRGRAETIRTSDLPRGIYILRINRTTGTICRKFIKN
jgi:hypothetical protein